MVRKRRLLILVFTVWFAFNPLVVQILQANDAPPPTATDPLPQPTINDMQLPDGVVPMNDVVKPRDYLEEMLRTRRGLDQTAAIDRAWADWMMTMGNVYQIMDEGSQDVFSYYEALANTKKVYDTTMVGKKVINYTPEMIKGMAKAAEFCAFLFAFLDKSKVGTWGENLFTGLSRNLVRGSKAVAKMNQSNCVLKFIEHMQPPPCWDAAKGEGFKSYFRWVKRVTHTEAKADSGKFVIKTSKGVARTIGIGLTVMGVVLDAYHLATSDDTHGGRWGSFDTVKTIISGTLGLAILVCMFCPPPFGQIFAAAALIWFVITEIGAFIGSYNKRWKEAYKGSYWFLHEQDRDFKSFYDNRSALTKEEKAASLLVAEAKIGKMVKEQEPLAKNEDEQKDFERGKSVWEAMEKQGVLMSYYSRGDLVMPDLELQRLMELWQKKADFMSWKPTEKEAEKAKKRGFWGKVLHAVNPMTYVTWAGDKIQSRGYNQEAQNLPRVWFNPDFYLLKKYQNYLLLKRARGKLYDLVSLRIEQAPFNYIPLVGIDTAAWSDQLLIESFMGDSMIVGQKEMVVFRRMAENQVAQAKKTYEDMRERLSQYQRNDFSGELDIRIEALTKLAQAFKGAPDAANDQVFSECQRVFHWQWPSSLGQKTPRAIIRQYRPYIEQTLQMLPITNGYQAGEWVQMQDTLKANLDSCALMEHMGQQRMRASQNVDADFKNEAIRKYLKEGTFLDVRGSTFMDWLGEVYPTAEELRKASDLFLDQVRKYREILDDFKNSDLGRILQATNDGQNKLKDLLELWRGIGPQCNIQVVVDPGDNRVFPDDGYKLPLPDGIEPLDPTKPIGNLDTGGEGGTGNIIADLQAIDVNILYPPGM